MSLCLVTAFFDIGRNAWSQYRRSVDEYFNSFKPYLDLKHEMIVFIDDRYSQQFRDLCNNNTNITIIDINMDWLMTNIHAYGRLDQERAIMKSDSYKQLVSHRSSCPECFIPEYNMLQHAKIDFVCYVIVNKLSSAEYFAWTDFGYFKSSKLMPNNPLQLDKFDLKKINFQTINPVREIDNDINYTLKVARETIGGFFHLGSKELLLKYQELYHEVHEDFHNKGVVDDDQHLMLQCYFRNRDMFHLWDLHGWHLIYTYFQQ